MEAAKHSSPLPPFDETRPFKVTQPPNPTWKTQGGLLDDTPLTKAWKAGTKQGWKSWDMDTTLPSDAYRMLTSAIVPRPIAFVSTLSPSGVPNLAPFSYFSMISHNPPMVSVSFSLSPRRPKDTRENILATKEFVVNIISEPFVEAANSTSVEAPEDVDEWTVAGLTKEPSLRVRPPRVQESAVSLECELFSSQDLYPEGASGTAASTTVVLGRIKYAHVHEAVLQPDGVQIDPAKLRAVSRLGGTTYARVSEAFDIKRPSWKNVKNEMDGDGDAVGA